MAKGQNAKNLIGNKIVEIFKKDFIKVEDKKIYLWADDGDGERVQIAISLTCPKDQDIIDENSEYVSGSDDEINRLIMELGL
jgi:hypothetical protein